MIARYASDLFHDPRILTITSPKRTRTENGSSAGWYPYYAGFSSNFVREILLSAKVTEASVILDPWNGSGTTTTTASRLGLQSVGIDLNPVMSLVAWAQTAKRSVLACIPSLIPRIRKLTQRSVSYQRFSDDPLDTWFTPTSSDSVRRLQTAIAELTTIHSELHPGRTHLSALSGMTATTAFFYVALFRTIRHNLKPFSSSNPTWLKTPRTSTSCLSLTMDALLDQFESQVSFMLDTIAPETRSSTVFDIHPRLLVASSEALPLQDGSVDLVLSSPPYCTRIDYAVATMSELAVMGHGLNEGFRELRRRLIGTPLVQTACPLPSPAWGPTASSFLEELRAHQSKASSTYYYQTHLQYYSAIYQSLREISRVLAPGGCCILVVQDSFYKDLHNDLAQILAEMTARIGLRLTRKEDFPLSQLMAKVHPHTRNYRKRISATESVLCFAKAHIPQEEQ